MPLDELGAKCPRPLVTAANDQSAVQFQARGWMKQPAPKRGPGIQIPPAVAMAINARPFLTPQSGMVLRVMGHRANSLAKQ
jgi:hypothetical protein